MGGSKFSAASAVSAATGGAVGGGAIGTVSANAAMNGGGRGVFVFALTGGGGANQLVAALGDGHLAVGTKIVVAAIDGRIFVAIDDNGAEDRCDDHADVKKGQGGVGVILSIDRGAVQIGLDV